MMAEIGCERGGEGEISTTRSRPNHGFLYWRDSNHESNHGFPCSDNLNSVALGGVLSLLFLFAHIYSLGLLLPSLFFRGEAKQDKARLFGWLALWLVGNASRARRRRRRDARQCLWSSLAWPVGRSGRLVGWLVDSFVGW